MTIPELLTEIAGNDDLPRQWRVMHEKTWLLDGTTIADQVTTRLEYKAEGTGQASPPWTPCASLAYTENWVNKIVVRRNVVASILIPLQAVAGSTRLEIEPEPEVPS